MKPVASAALIGMAAVAFAAFAAAQPEPGEHGRHRLAPPAGSGHWARGGQEDIAEQFRKHRPKPAELQAKLSELRASAAARRDAHRAELRAQFGPALARKDLEEELRKHARRLAFLNRAKVVATSELEEPKRTTALARIDKLLTSENARHDGAVQKLRAPAPVASASATPAPEGSTP